MSVSNLLLSFPPNEGSALHGGWSALLAMVQWSPLLTPPHLATWGLLGPMQWSKEIHKGERSKSTNYCVMLQNIPYFLKGSCIIISLFLLDGKSCNYISCQGSVLKCLTNYGVVLSLSLSFMYLLAVASADLCIGAGSQFWQCQDYKSHCSQ